MKNVFQFLQMNHKHMDHQLCHPRRQASFDNDSIQKKIDEIRQKKQQLRVQAERKKQQLQVKQQRFQDFPLQEVLQQSINPLEESISMMIKQKIKFIEEKVYIGTKNNINSEYIIRAIDINEAKPAIKYQLSLFMEDLIGNLEADIAYGEYQIFNKKDTIVPKHQKVQSGLNESSATKLINIKKVQLSQKIQQLKDQLIKTQLEQEKLSPASLQKRKSSSVKTSRINNSMINSLNIDEFSIKSQKTKQAQNFIKKIQKQQQQQRKSRKKRQQEFKIIQVKSQQQKKQFQEHMKKQKHEKLKKRFQAEKKLKIVDFEKKQKAKIQFQKFLSEYHKRIPLFREKQLKFNKQLQKQQKQRSFSVLSEIKQAKRSIDLNQLKQHENKYKLVRQQYQKQKLASLKHRRKQIYLRQKQDKLYFRGRYHSLIKEQINQQPVNQTEKKDQLIEKMKSYALKVKKQFAPSIDHNKQKELDQLIQKINRNKPNLESKDSNQLGNNYLQDLHHLVKQMKEKGKIKFQLSQEIKPRYRNYLQDLKKSRNYQTISYDKMTQVQLQQQALKTDQKVLKKQQILALSNHVDINKQLQELNDLDLDLLRSAQIKAKLLEKYEPSMDQDQNYHN